MNDAIACSLSRTGTSLAVALGDRLEQEAPALGEERVEHLVLRAEVVIDEPVGDVRLVARCPTRGSGGSPRARTRGSRRRGSRGACRRRRRGARSSRAPPRALRPAVGAAAAGSRARAASSRTSRCASRSRSAATKHSSSGACGEHRSPRVDDHRVAVALVVGRMLADLAGGDHEGLVLDRARAQQHLPVGPAGRHGERRRQRERRARRARP